MNMNKNNWKTYAFWILLSEAVGLLAGILTRSATQKFGQTAIQPPLSPPAIVFPIVWTILYALMGFGAARIRLSPPSQARGRGINLFIAQLTVNFFWPLIFFNLQAFGIAFVWLILLWVLVAMVIRLFWKVDRTAAWLLVPYIVWLTFAAVLNLFVYFVN